MAAREATSYGGATVGRRRARATGARRRLAGLVWLVGALAWAPVGRAEVPDPARAAGLRAARRAASDTLDALVARLAPDVRRRLTGVYVAFDETGSSVDALAACDDDGDYVVVVSD